MSTLPALYFSSLHTRRQSRPRDGLTVDVFVEFVEKLAGADVHSPAVTSMVEGRFIQTLDRPHVLLCLGDSSRKVLGHWSRLARSTYTSVLCCASADLNRADHVSVDDLPLLTGHGIIIASRGVTGDALAGMRVNRLREELNDSRARLSRATGYEVRLLAPSPTTLGTVVDGLVLEEARRAGYRRVLHPGGGILNIDDDPIADRPGGCARLPYRPVQTDDAPDALVSWIVGDGLTRPAARLKHLARTPRRLMDRLKDQL